MSPWWKKEEKTSYVKEMVTSPPSQYGFLGSVALGTLLAIPFGVGIAALPLLAYGASTSIAALFVPNHPAYRARVDAKRRALRRDEARRHFEEEVRQKNKVADANWGTYQRMLERLESLRKVARNRKTNVSQADVEQLDDVTVNYLGMWLSLLGIIEWEHSASNAALERKIAEVEALMKKVSSTAERRRLETARDDFKRALLRRQQLSARKAQVEASMLAVADTFEEVYQGVMTNPESTDVARRLQEAAERMQIEEGLGSAIDEELDELVSRRRRASATVAQKK